MKLFSSLQQLIIKFLLRLKTIKGTSLEDINYVRS